MSPSPPSARGRSACARGGVFHDLKTARPIDFPEPFLKMRSKPFISALNLAASLIGMACVALPAFAQTNALLRVAVTIDSSGNQTYVGCNATTCPGTATVTSGSITWTGSIGGITVTQINGRTQPALAPPNIDIGSTLRQRLHGAITISDRYGISGWRKPCRDEHRSGPKRHRHIHRVRG